MFSQVQARETTSLQDRAALRASSGVGSIAIVKSRGVPVGLAPRGLDGGTLNLVKSVPALVARGLRVSIFTSDIELDAPRIERLGRVEIHRLPGLSGSGLVGDVLDLERARAFETRLLDYPPFAARSFDVLHTHHWTSALPKLLLGHRCAWHLHTPHLLVAEKAAMTGKAPSWEALAIERGGLVMADRIIAVSSAEAGSIMTRYGISAAKLRVIPNGVSEDFLNSKTSPRTIAARIAARPLQVVSVGRLVPQKGFDILLRAIALVRTSGIEIQCAIVGTSYHSEPAYPAELDRLVQDLGLTSAVSFLGEQDSAGVARSLASAAVYVQPTRYESQGVAILEAMAMGLPIVTTRLPAVAEFVDHGRNGLLVGADDAVGVAAALVRLAHDPGGADAMSAANRAKAATFDWEVSNQMLIDCMGFGDEARV